MYFKCNNSNIITPEGLFFSTYIYILFLNLHSGVNCPNCCRLYVLRVLSSTIQALLLPGTKFNHLGRVFFPIMFFHWHTVFEFNLILNEFILNINQLELESIHLKEPL